MDIFHATPDGFISEKQARVASIIQDYDPDLELVWIPPNQRLPEDDGKEFAVLHRRPDYIVFYVRADEVDERVLQRLWRSDNSNGNVLNAMDAHNAAVEAMRMREQLDREEETADIARTVLASKLNTFKHDGVTYQ